MECRDDDGDDDAAEVTNVAADAPTTTPKPCKHKMHKRKRKLIIL